MRKNPFRNERPRYDAWARPVDLALYLLGLLLYALCISILFL